MRESSEKKKAPKKKATPSAKPKKRSRS